MGLCERLGLFIAAPAPRALLIVRRLECTMLSLPGVGAASRRRPGLAPGTRQGWLLSGPQLSRGHGHLGSWLGAQGVRCWGAVVRSTIEEREEGWTLVLRWGCETQ